MRPDPADDPTRPIPAAGRPRGRLRALVRWSIRLVLVLAIFLQVVYLARRPLVERWLLDTVASLVGERLGARVEIDALEGNWLTDVRVAGLTIADGTGPVLALDGASLTVTLDPWRLVFGDLGGATRAQLRAARLVVDPTAPLPPATAPPPVADEPAAPFDPRALLAAFPRGIDLVVDEVRIRGRNDEVTTPVRLRLDAIPDDATPTSRRAELTGARADLDVRMTATAEPGGGLEFAVGATVDDPLRFATPFGGELPVRRGVLAVDAAVTSFAPFTCHAAATLLGAHYADARIDELHASATWSGTTLTNGSAWARVGEASARVDGIGLTLADVLGSLNGTVFVSAPNGRDVTGFVPQDLATDPNLRLASTHVELLTTLVDGAVTVHAGDLRGYGVHAIVAGGPLDLAAPLAARTELRLDARLVDPTALPLGPAPPLRPETADVRGTVSVDAGTATASLEFSTALLDAADRPLTSSGTVSIRRESGADAPVIVEPALVANGSWLGVPERVDLAGRLTLAADTLSVDALAIEREAPDLAGRANITAELPLGSAADLGAWLERASLDATWTAFRLDEVFALLGLEALGGEATGEASWNGTAEAPLRLRLETAVTGLVTTPGDPAADPAPSRATVAATLDTRGLVVDELAATVGSNTVRGSARLEAVTVADLVGDDPSRWLERPLTAALAIDAPRLAELALDRLGGATPVDGRVRGELSVAGTPRQPTPTLELEDARTTIAGVPLIAAASLRTDGQALVLERARLDVDGSDGHVEVSGRLGSLDATNLVDTLLTDASIDARIAKLDLGPFLDAPRPTESTDEGTDHVLPSVVVDGDLTWATGGDPNAEPRLGGTLAATLRQWLPGRPAAEGQLNLDVVVDGRSARIETLRFAADQGSFSGSASLDGVTCSTLLREPAAAANAALAANFAFEAFDLSNLDAERLGMTDLGGILSGTIVVDGTPAAPRPRAELAIDDGRLRPRGGGQRLDKIRGALVLREQEIQIDGLRAELGAGPLTIDGVYRTTGALWDGIADGALDAKITGDDVLLYRRAGLRIRAGLDVTAVGPLEHVDVRGRVELEGCKYRSRIPLFSFSESGGESAVKGIVLSGPELGEGIGVFLDLELVTKEPIAIQTNVLRGDIATALQLTGPIEHPTLLGNVSAANAAVIFPGCRFVASTLLMRFEQDDPQFPTLTVNAIGRRHGIDVNLVVSGKIDEPEIILSSNPPLPTDELAVLVTTGQRPESLKRKGARGVATVLGSYLVQELADYLFGSDSTEAKESFIERFTIETGTEISADGNESILIEFRMFDRVYLQGERDVYEDVNLGVVYRIRFR